MGVIAVFMIGSVVRLVTPWRRLPALTRPARKRMQRDREKFPPCYQSLTQCPERTKSPDGLSPALAGAASMLTARRDTLKNSFSEVSARATVAVPPPGTPPTRNAALPSR